MPFERFAACAGSEKSTISARRHRNAHFWGIVRRTKSFLHVENGWTSGIPLLESRSASGLNVYFSGFRAFCNSRNFK